MARSWDSFYPFWLNPINARPQINVCFFLIAPTGFILIVEWVVSLYFVRILETCFTQSLLSCSKASSLLCKFIRKVEIYLSTVCACVVVCICFMIFPCRNFIYLVELSAPSSSLYNCFGFPQSLSKCILNHLLFHQAVYSLLLQLMPFL